MNIKQILVFFIVELMFITIADAQQTVIGQWKQHLPTKNAIAVAEGNGKVYCATESIIYELNKADNALSVISKINGLSDVGITDIKYCDALKAVIVVYKNANIDIIENSRIINISDIKRANITGKKTINSIYVRGSLAYLSCGFGIIVLDVMNKELKETYLIGGNGTNVNIRSVVASSTKLFAATDSGVFAAELNGPNLSDYRSWKRQTALPRGVFNTITAIGDSVYAGYSFRLSNGTLDNDKDTLYVYAQNKWEHFKPHTSGFVIRYINSYKSRFMAIFDGYIEVYNADFSDKITYSAFQTKYSILPNTMLMESDEIMWIADKLNGLMKVTSLWTTERFTPDGPLNSKCYSLDAKNGALYVATGARNSVWDGQYNNDGIFYLKDGYWGTINSSSIPALDLVRDVVSVTIDPNNTGHIFAGCLGKGLLEFTNGALTAMYDGVNNYSSLKGRLGILANGVYVFDSQFDKDGNLWVTNSQAKEPLSVLKKDGTWESYKIDDSGKDYTVNKVVITQSGQKWLTLPRGEGLMVFDEEKSGDNRYKHIKAGKGAGGLPTNEVISIAEDRQGEIWLGTEAGVYVFYSPDNVLSANSQDAQPVYLQQDGHTQILLLTEVVTAIAVDGANRKWLGTQNAGVFLMSADGTTQLLHFDITNSPLISNNIVSISIDHKSGEVFFATETGILSYKGAATEGLEYFEDVYAYPNPVKHDYTGIIAIKGLVENADVKITDIAGNIIYQTKALGGQAIWNGKKFNGERPNTGVYMVYCSNADGSKTHVTKLLFVN